MDLSLGGKKCHQPQCDDIIMRSGAPHANLSISDPGAVNDSPPASSLRGSWMPNGSTCSVLAGKFGLQADSNQLGIWKLDIWIVSFSLDRSRTLAAILKPEASTEKRARGNLANESPDVQTCCLSSPNKQPIRIAMTFRGAFISRTKQY